MESAVKAIRSSGDGLKAPDAIKSRVSSAGSHAQRRNPNEATASVARKLWLLIELILRGRVSFAAYEDLHRRDYRSFQRDLQQLRGALRDHDVAISAIKEHAYVDLSRSGGQVERKHVLADETSRLIAAIAVALGEPIRAVLHAPAEPEDRFFTFAMPQLVDGTRIAELARLLREATFSSGGRAFVSFRYHGANRAERTSRLVEPYRLFVRSGTFYLLGYDRRRRGWRFFALDRIEGTPERAGTAGPDRVIPPEYASPDAIGFIKRDHSPRQVTVRVSPRVAASATARRWQKSQRTALRLDGSADITFTVTDESEVIRWALGFGNEARIISPPSATKAAVVMIGEMADTYSHDDNREEARD